MDKLMFMVNAFGRRINFALLLCMVAQCNSVAAQNLSVSTKVISDETYVSHAAQLIEIQMDWGSIEKWTDFEFERLSDVMHDSTGRRVNADKLALILQTKKYDSSLSVSYDVLAQFLHYPDWNSFKQMTFIKENEVPRKGKDE